MNLLGDSCCLEMDLTVDRSAPPHARGAAPAYYLDRSSVGGCACLNAPTTQIMQWWENTRVDAPNLKRGNMTWNAPKIVEVAVGMEINMYACALRKT
jgi:coenzyme PQQ precursor peptide PqqA